MRSTFSVESLDLIITPISLPTMVPESENSDSDRHYKQFVPYSFRVQGVRTIHSAGNVLLVDSSNQQKEKGHEAPPIADSASSLIDKIIYVLTFLITIFILGLVFRLVASSRSDAS